jgi:hypothetical protein
MLKAEQPDKGVYLIVVLLLTPGFETFFFALNIYTG